MAGVAAEVVRCNLDPAFADRRGPEEIDREPAEMGEAVVAAARSIARQISAEGGPAC